MGLRVWAEDFLGLLFPNVCEVCGRTLVHGERLLCLHCIADMPRTGIHGDGFTDIHKRLAGRTPIHRAAAYFHYYRDNPYARMIQAAKYNSRPRLARELARMFASEIAGSGFFDGIDMILPVPLHSFKELRRGYNQSREIARGLRDITGIAIGDNLEARRGHSTQTRRNAYERWINTEDIYCVAAPHELDGKHLLLVDDVITTGATMLRCAEAIHAAAPGAVISVAALGFTHGI